MANKKISQLTAKGTPIAPTDLVEIAEDDGAGGYVTKSVSGLQPTLVSGTNITTINSASLLGGGNVNLQTPLVSGTNIKTINSTTLLGSGDIVLGSGVHVLTKPVTGRSYSVRLETTQSTSSTFTLVNTIYLSPFVPANSLTVSALTINVTTLTVGGNARILVYSDLNGVPSSKLLESTSLDCSTTGVKTYTASFTFTAGTTYWLGVYSNLSVALSSVIPAQLIPISTSLFTSGFGIVTAAATFPTAPSTLGTATLGTAAANMFVINLTAA